MEAERFDHWTRSLAEARTRRGIAKALGAAALGVLLGARAPEEAAADCHPRCGVCHHCRRGHCHKQQDGTDCGDGRTCQDGACQRLEGCPPPDKKCRDGSCCNTSACEQCQNGHCVKLCNDGQRCENNTCSCDRESCPQGCCQNDQCKGGGDDNTCGRGGEACVACPGGQHCCGGVCVDTDTDPNHCGSCSRRCDAGERCKGGKCGCDVQSCPTGCCDTNGICQPGNTDQRCGAGGAACAACPSGQHCVGGTCGCDAQSCPHGCCQGNQCKGGGSDDTCGTGGVKCAACAGSEHCCSGVCCGAAATDCCHGSCVDTDTDAANCGFCGFSCIPDVPCVGGTCQGGCVAPFKQCLDGTCCDTSQCRFCQGGTCVTWCDEPGKRCENNTCICDAQSCPPDKGCCTGGPGGGDCKAIDLNTDPKNCGSCGHTCAAKVPCVGGVCQGNCDPRVEMCLDGTCCDTSQCHFCKQGTCVSSCQAGQRCVNNECICDGQTCPKGCCKDDQCVPFGHEHYGACGTGGETCFVCPGNPGNITCCSGVCCRYPGSAGQGPICCPGPNSDFARGTCTDLISDSNNCGDCSHKCTEDQHCVGGHCVCDGQTCPNGCCDANGRCRSGDTNQVCGKGGVPCATCGSGNHCVAKQCVCDKQTCGFDQCCENGPGNPGRCIDSDADHCGTNGAQCQKCGLLEECNYWVCR